jgi:hypothetical protein
LAINMIYRPPPSVGCSVRTWQAICNTAEQQLASYLQNRPATIGNQAATPEIQLANVPDPSHFGADPRIHTG